MVGEEETGVIVVEEVVGTISEEVDVVKVIKNGEGFLRMVEVVWTSKSEIASVSTDLVKISLKFFCCASYLKMNYNELLNEN